MLRHLIILSGIIGIAGCTSGKIDTATRTQMAAFAASEDNAYPNQAKASDDLRVAAIVDREDGVVRVYNFTDERISNAKLWVNQQYVYRIPAISPNDSVKISRARLYNSRGASLSREKAPISNVQLQRGDELSNLMGPVFE
jgi:hypothetical protein